MTAPISNWQKKFDADDFEKNYLPRLEVPKLLEMEKAQLCVSKCKRAEIVFNRATILNQEAAGTFLNKCISKVGIKDFRAYSSNDENITAEQANRMLYCITTGKKISESIDIDLRNDYLGKYQSIIDEKFQ